MLLPPEARGEHTSTEDGDGPQDSNKKEAEAEYQHALMSARMNDLVNIRLNTL